MTSNLRTIPSPECNVAQPMLPTMHPCRLHPDEPVLVNLRSHFVVHAEACLAAGLQLIAGPLTILACPHPRPQSARSFCTNSKCCPCSTPPHRHSTALQYPLVLLPTSDAQHMSPVAGNTSGAVLSATPAQHRMHSLNTNMPPAASADSRRAPPTIRTSSLATTRSPWSTHRMRSSAICTSI